MRNSSQSDGICISNSIPVVIVVVLVVVLVDTRRLFGSTRHLNRKFNLMRRTVTSSLSIKASKRRQRRRSCRVWGAVRGALRGSVRGAGRGAVGAANKTITATILSRNLRHLGIPTNGAIATTTAWLLRSARLLPAGEFQLSFIFVVVGVVAIVAVGRPAPEMT